MLKQLRNSKRWFLIPHLFFANNNTHYSPQLASFNQYQFTTFPFNTIGWISLTQKDSNSISFNKYAVGFQISSCLVLSSSNNFISLDEKRSDVRQYMPTLFTVVQTDDKGTKISKSSQIKQFIINIKYRQLLNRIAALKKMRSNEGDKNLKTKYNNQIEVLQSEAIQHDYSLLKLQEPLEKTQYFQLWPNLSLQQKVVISGYLHQQNNDFRLLTRSNNLNTISKGRLYYDIEIPGDLSGAPVYLFKNNSKLVGIHKSHLPSKRLSLATLVTKSMIDALAAWDTEMKPSIDNINENSDHQKIRNQKQSSIQEVQQLLKRGHENFQGDKFSQALQLYTKALNIQQKLEGNESQDYVNILMAICCVHQQKDQFEETKNILKKILTILEKANGKKSLESADIYFCIGETLQAEGKIEQSIEQFKVVLSIYEKEAGKDQLISASLCARKIGRVYYNSGKFNQSIEYFIKGLKIYENVEGKEHFECGRISFQIGFIFCNHDQEKFSQALEYLNRAMSIYQKNNKKKDSIQYADILHTIGIVYNNQGKFNEALKNYSQALRMKERVAGKESFVCVVTLDCIGYVYKTLGDDKLANEFFFRSKAIKKANKNKK